MTYSFFINITIIIFYFHSIIYRQGRIQPKSLTISCIRIFPTLSHILVITSTWWSKLLVYRHRPLLWGHASRVHPLWGIDATNFATRRYFSLALFWFLCTLTQLWYFVRCVQHFARCTCVCTEQTDRFWLFGATVQWSIPEIWGP